MKKIVITLLSLIVLGGNIQASRLKVFFEISENLKSTVTNEYDLDELVEKIIVDCKSDKEKALKIAHYIMDQIEYDYGYLETREYANDQNDTKAILFGKNKLAVCEGYSKVFKDLCTRAGVKCEYVVGNTKHGFSDISKVGNYHAWNVVWLSDKPYIFDITWADGGDDEWLMTDPEMMIYSHFPDDPKYQLLEETVSLKEFRKMCVLVPQSSDKFHPFDLNTGVVFEPSGQMEIKFLGDVDVSVITISDEIFNYAYRGEEGASRSFSYSFNEVELDKIFDGDSTTIKLTLPDKSLGMRLSVDGCYDIFYHIIDRSRKEHLSDLVKNFDSRKAQSLTKGFCAALSLGDLESLKSIAPKLNLTKTDFDLYKNKIGEWDGTIGELTMVSYTHLTINESHEYESVVEIYHEVEVNDEISLRVEKEDDKWSIIQVEI